ncbi:MAG TPA: lipid-binding SYLF domain-containing protein [Candidatus Polarisedimenticolaceae bacterium]|nr:lipid-binding SYLF domain-containing protein [Candidatus Polarisedimenticolaceae bacterium]
MRKTLLGALALFGTALAVHAARKVEDYSKTIAEFKKISVVAPFFDSAYGYAVFPTVGKGGLGIGASHGKGQVYQGGKVIGFTSTSDVSIGLQAGGQAYSQVVFFEDKESLERFTSGNFEFAASASAIAVQSTAGASAGTEGTTASAAGKKTEVAAAGAEYQNGMAVFTMAKGGLMYAATIAGQKYTYKPVKK